MRIASPCHENYSNMSEQGNGRYCGSCEKVVVDFTKMSNTEMLNFFEHHKGENICGRVKSIQLGKQNAYASFIYKSRQFVADKINITPLRIALLAMISGLLAFTTSCMGEVIPYEKTAQPTKDTVKTKNNPPRK